jgi:riboflavin synthase
LGDFAQRLLIKVRESTMFTGLIETIGTVIAVERKGNAVLLGIRPADTRLIAARGSSVAVDGVCLTVENSSGPALFFTAVAETLGHTTLATIQRGCEVNLEQPLSVQARFDGHMVLGHVDGVGTIIADRMEDAGRRRTIEVPESCRRFMAEKGSVAIDGISLTIADTGAGKTISIALVPQTMAATTMRNKGVGDKVNIECDIIARYLDRLLRSQRTAPTVESETLLEQMERLGF